MRQLVITRYGGPEVLEVREVPTPDPGPDEVRIRAVRAGLNFSDLAARVGLYLEAPKPPMVMGYEVAGFIEAVGAGVKELAPGQRVVGVSHFGGQASHVVLPARRVLRLPDEVSFDAAAAIPVNALTAFHIFFHVHWLKPGEHVLIHMASGGVGQTAIQLARSVPGVVTYGTASASKHDFLRSLGLDHPIDYRNQDYVAEVQRLSGGRGLDLVLDPLGGPDWKKGYHLLRPGGHLVACGWANMVSGTRRNVLTVARQFAGLPHFTPMGLMQHNRTVSGVNLGGLWSEEALLRSHMLELLERARTGKLKLHIDSVHPLSSAAAAHQRIHDRQNVGKVLFDCEQ